MTATPRESTAGPDVARDVPLSRRRLLQLSAASGTALLGGTTLLAGAAAATDPAGSRSSAPAPVTSSSDSSSPLVVPSPGPTANPATGVTFFSQADLEFEVLFGFGGTAYGVGEFGELITTVNQIQAAGPSYQTYYDNFVATGQRVAALADRERAAGHRASARLAYLRAAQYFDQALFFVLGTSTPDAEAAVYATMQRQWNRAAQLMDPPFERVAIPYGQSTLPGYFLRPSTSNVRRPTVIVNNGSDAQNLDTYAWGGAAAVERGWNALLFEGPGQGSMLFERQIPFRPDWEKVITPVVDWLVQRPDVDPSRIALTGWSFGGDLVARAAAYEPRLAAVCSDPGMTDPFASWPESVRSLFAPGATREAVNGAWNEGYVSAIDADPITKFTVSKRAEIYGKAELDAARAGKLFTDMWSFGHTIMQYNPVDTLHRITMPYLVTEYELDTAVSADQPATMYARVGSEQKKLVTFTTAQGAEYHCAPMAPQTRNQVVYDWIDRVFAKG